MRKLFTHRELAAEGWKLCRLSFRGVYSKATAKSNMFVNIQLDGLTNLQNAL